MKINLRSRRVRRPLIWFAVLGVAFYFIVAPGFPTPFDVVYMHGTRDFDTDIPNAYQISGGQTVRRNWLGANVEMGAPYVFHACKEADNGPNAIPHAAELFKAVDGGLVPVEAEFTFSQDWVQRTLRDICLLDILTLNVEIGQQEIYCIDLHYVWFEEPRTARDCWKLRHEAGIWHISILDMMRYAS